MADIDLARVRLVSRHFHDLQGLRIALLGAALGILAQVWLLTRSETWTVFAGLCVFLAIIYPTVMLNRYYATRVGRVVPEGREQFWRGCIGSVAIVLFRVESHAAPAYPSFPWLLLGAYPLWLAIDGWPYRWYQLLTFLAAVFVAFGHVGLTRSSPELAWMAPRMWAVSLALIATGLFDHFLLLRIIESKHDAVSEAAAEHADTV